MDSDHLLVLSSTSEWQWSALYYIIIMTIMLYRSIIIIMIIIKFFRSSCDLRASTLGQVSFPWSRWDSPDDKTGGACREVLESSHTPSSSDCWFHPTGNGSPHYYNCCRRGLKGMKPIPLLPVFIHMQDVKIIIILLLWIKIRINYLDMRNGKLWYLQD